MGPDYKRPEIAAPAAFQYETKDAVDSSDTLWWQQFGDPVLDALIDEALAQQQQRHDRRRECRAGRGGADADPLAAVPASRLRRGADEQRSTEPAVAAQLPN